jgi:hypothetical protein
VVAYRLTILHILKMIQSSGNGQSIRIAPLCERLDIHAVCD